jgi:hypothetical protein
VQQADAREGVPCALQLTHWKSCQDKSERQITHAGKVEDPALLQLQTTKISPILLVKQMIIPVFHVDQGN